MLLGLLSARLNTRAPIARSSPPRLAINDRMSCDVYECPAKITGDAFTDGPTLDKLDCSRAAWAVVGIV